MAQHIEAVALVVSFPLLLADVKGDACGIYGDIVTHRATELPLDDAACITLDIRKQQWKGYYKGNGLYVLRHSTYYTGTLPYVITSTIDGFEPIMGEITVENTWDVKPHDTDYQVGSHWWTDSYVPADYWHDCAGANTQRIVRKEIMEDWAKRWAWLKE